MVTLKDYFLLSKCITWCSDIRPRRIINVETKEKIGNLGRTETEEYKEYMDWKIVDVQKEDMWISIYIKK